MLLDSLFNSGERVTAAIKSASQQTGISFDYLLKTAYRESALNPKAQAQTSSALGLFQFIDTTWLATVKEDGPSSFTVCNQVVSMNWNNPSADEVCACAFGLSADSR